MRVLPILFNTDMVRAILDGRKTVTRRVLKNLPKDAEYVGQLEDSFDPWDEKDIGKSMFKTSLLPTEKAGCIFIKPPYQTGDILYVRETWQECCRNTIHSQIVHNKYCFKASVDNPIYGCIDRECGQICNWKPSIHMPKEAARIWLRVTDVRVERLQDITTEQILREGANTEAIKHYIKQMPDQTDEWIDAAHKVEFQQLWDSTIKKSDIDRYGWDANPWVWVIEFERCEKPEEKK